MAERSARLVKAGSLAAGMGAEPSRPPTATRSEYALVLVFLLLAAVIIVAGNFIFRKYEENHRLQMESQLSSIATLKTNELQAFREERFGDASVLFGNDSFAGLVRRFLEHPGDAEAGTQLRVWIGKYLLNAHYDRVFLLDTRGAVRMSTSGGTAVAAAAVALESSEALALRQVTFLDFYRDEHDGNAYFAVLVPVLEGRRDAPPLGVLVLRVDPQAALYPSIKQWPSPQRTAETLLVRRDGDDALFLNELKHRDDPPLTVRIPLDPKKNIAAVQAVLGREGIMEGVDYGGIPVLAELRAVSGSPWYLVVRMDLSEVYAPVRHRLWLTVFLVGIQLLAAAAGVGMLWRHQRVRFYRERYETEKERAWLRDVISRSLNEIYVFDPRTLRFKFINEGGLRNLGYGMEEIQGMTPLDIKADHTEETFRAMIRPLVRKERELLVIESMHRRKDGSEYPVEVHLQLVPTADGAAFLAIADDITERKRAEDRIRKGIRLEAALHRIDTQILEGRDTGDALGIACEAIVEMGYRMCWIGEPGPDHVVRPIARSGVDEGYLDSIEIRWDDSSGGGDPSGAVIRTGRTCVVRSVPDSPHFGPWRESALAHGFLSMGAFPLKDEDGKVTGVLHAYGDRAEAFGEEEIGRLEMFAQQCSIAMMSVRRLKNLRDAHRRILFHVNVMPLAYIVWDRDFRATEWNPAAERIFGWKAEEALGRHAYEVVVPPEARAHVDRVWANLLKGRGPDYSLNANVRKDGKTITCEWFNTTLTDSAGEVTGILSMVHDVTEKAELQRQLQTAQRMEAVGTLAGGIAHDFNNALTGIFGFAELLKMQLGDNPRALADLDEIFRSAERASLLTRQLLTFARRQVIEPSNINLNRVIGDLMKLCSKIVGEQIEIRTVFGKDMPSILADVGQIEQVVMNLVLNARDAMPGGGRLTIETGLAHLDDGFARYHPYMEVGSYVVLTVSDTGVGMDRKTRERVFEPFFTTKGPEKGTGLGLAMVYGIVKQHKGFIHLYSEPGKGTTFKVYLPPVEAPPDEVTPSGPSGTPGGTETILLAEDDGSVRMLIERTLSDLGYTVLSARDGMEAVETFRRNGDRVDLAILDVVMPRLGGKEAYEELHKERPDLKVIFMSGYTANAVHESFVLIAGIPFLAKPLGPGALARKVREVLDGR